MGFWGFSGHCPAAALFCLGAGGHWGLLAGLGRVGHFQGCLEAGVQSVLFHHRDLLGGILVLAGHGSCADSKGLCRLRCMLLLELEGDVPNVGMP